MYENRYNKQLQEAYNAGYNRALNEQVYISGPKRIPTPGRPLRTSENRWFFKKPDGTYDVIPDWLWDGNVGSSWGQIILNSQLNIPGGPGDMTDHTIVGGSDDFDINNHDGWMGIDGYHPLASEDG